MVQMRTLGLNDRSTPLHLAAWNKPFEIVQMLLEHHAHVRNARGEVALHFAACHYEYPIQVHIRRLLLDHGADVNARDEDGSTRLHQSSFRIPGPSDPGWGSAEGTHLLLEHGAKIDAENNKGETPSLVALGAEYHGMGELLWGLGTMLTCLIMDGAALKM